MKITKKQLKKKIRKALEKTKYQGEDRLICDSDRLTLSAPMQTPDMRPMIHFQVYPASGGYVSEVRTFCKKTGNTNTTLHIIPSEQELGEALSKIITIETLKV
jgi:hypothetical protein